MSFSLLFPLGLAALAALIVPLLIHWIRRPDDRVVIFPAMRWLAIKVRPRRRRRFDNLWLLLLRLLLIALLALLIAEPFVEGAWRSPRTWVAVAANAELPDSARASIEPSAEWRWMAKDFPRFDTPRPDGEQPVASLLREFDASIDPRDHIVAYVPEVVSGLDGERLRLSRNVDWRVVGTHKVTNAPSPKHEKPIRVGLHQGEKNADGSRYLRAAAAAWVAVAPDQFQLDLQVQDFNLDAPIDWLMWTNSNLSAPARAWVERGGSAIIIAPDDHAGDPVWIRENGEVLARATRVGKGRLISLQHPLTPDIFPELLEPTFPDQLRRLFDKRTVPPDRAVATAVSPERVDSLVVTPVRESLVDWLVLLIGSIFLIERIVATRRISA